MALANAIQSLLGRASSTDASTKKSNGKTESTSRSWNMWDVKELSNAEVLAFDEVRFAVEDIVFPTKQPVELLPQIPRILKMQVAWCP